MRIVSDLPQEIRDKFARIVTEAFQEGLLALEGATIKNPDQPHKLEASIEWISLYARAGQSPTLGSCTLRVNSKLHLKDGEGWKPIPGYCEAFQLDMSEIPEGEIEDELHDGILMTQFRVYEVTMSVSGLGKKRM